MKIIFIILVIFLIIPPLSHARDNTEYEVVIRIKYNAVSADRASEIISDAQKRYSDACEVEVTSKKVADSITGTVGHFYQDLTDCTLEITDNEVDANCPTMPGTLKINDATTSCAN
jgi:hypothetical protein